jgi:diaminopimelate epimerase
MPDYFKYHGLGNDYLVIEPGAFAQPVTAQAARMICDRHRGVGADGVLLGPLPGGEAEAPAVRILNPDGSEAEKSGNGLRIFARHLWERRLVRQTPFAIRTAGGIVQARILDDGGQRIALEMGAVSFDSARVPMSGPPRQVLRESLEVAGRVLTVSAANVGNPHCVVLVEDPSADLARELGPRIERHPSFPQRTNVQFVTVTGAHSIRMEIWERGAGYTLASGTSSCAAAAVVCRLGLCESPVAVQMPGGVLEVSLDAHYHAELKGEVASVCQGDFSEEFLRAIGLTRLP